MEKCRIDNAAVKEVRWRGNEVLDTGNFIFMYGIKESNTFGNGFLINSTYFLAIMVLF
jgi:hypothetical protein